MRKLSSEKPAFRPEQAILNTPKNLREHYVQDKFKESHLFWEPLVEDRGKDQTLLLQSLLIFEYRSNLLRQHLGMTVTNTIKNYKVDCFC